MAFVFDDGRQDFMSSIQMAVRDGLPPDAQDRTVAAKLAQTLREKFSSYKSLKWLERAYQSSSADLEFIGAHSPDDLTATKLHYDKCFQRLLLPQINTHKRCDAEYRKIKENIEAHENPEDLETYWERESLMLDAIYLFDAYVAAALEEIYQDHLIMLRTPSMVENSDG